MIEFNAVEFLQKNPLVLFFLVASSGYALGRIRVAGFSLGVAAVLFTGIGFGALGPEVKLPEFVYLFGLVIFVYTIGLSTAPGFRRSLSRRGLRDNLFAVCILVLGALFTFCAHLVLKLSPPLTAGLFSGSFTNTPALGAILETIKETTSGALLEKRLAEPVFAYSVAYPFGVIGIMLAIYLMQKIWKIDYTKEAEADSDLTSTQKKLSAITIKITKPIAEEKPLYTIQHEKNWHIIFTRLKRGETVSVIDSKTVVRRGDYVALIGTETDVQSAIALLGEQSAEEIDLDRKVLDYKRIFVSSKDVAEKPLSELFIPQRFGAIITRVRRGDIEFLPDKDTMLELGDRIRVVAPKQHLNNVSKFLGDSIKALSEIDVISFSLGIMLGLIIGMIPIPLPGENSFKLGFAGGPLIVGLYLGIKGRSGPFIWQLPYSANITLRQLGLVMFLAGIGTRSGYAFISTIQDGAGYKLFVSGAIITFVTVLTTLIIGYKFLKIPMGILIGMISGMHTQPAALAFANEQCEHELPNIGYATVYPISMVVKILFAQALLLFV